MRAPSNDAFSAQKYLDGWLGVRRARLLKSTGGVVIMATVVLMVTWFYYGQPPVSSQIEFSSMQACLDAK
jgi:hypothetical protein